MKNLKESLLGDQHINEDSWHYDSAFSYNFKNSNCFAEVVDFINYTKVMYFVSDLYNEIDVEVAAFKKQLQECGVSLNRIASTIDRNELLGALLNNSLKRSKVDINKKEYQLGSSMDILRMFITLDNYFDEHIKNWQRNTTIVVKQPTGADRFIEVRTDNRAAGVMLQEIAEKGELPKRPGESKSPFKDMEYVESKYGRCSLYFNV